MNSKNIDLLSSTSLPIATFLALAYTYLKGLSGTAVSDHVVGVEPLLRGWLCGVESQMPLLATILTLVLLVAGVMLNVSVSTRFNLFGRASQLPILFYTCVVVALSASGGNFLAPLASFIGVCSLRDFYRAYQSSSYTSRLFTAAFWMGLLPLIYPSSVVLWIASIIFLVLFVRSLREVVAVVIALILPVVSLIYMRWLFGEGISEQFAKIFDSLFSRPHYPTSTTLYLNIALLSLVALLSLYGFTQVGSMSLRYVERTRIYCAYILVAVAPLMLLFPSFSVESCVVLASPISIAITPALMRLRSWISIPLFVAIILLSMSSLLEF